MLFTLAAMSPKYLKSMSVSQDFFVSPSIVILMHLSSFTDSTETLIPGFPKIGNVSPSNAPVLGKIVVASDSGGIPEYVRDQQNGFLFKANSCQDLVRQIKNGMNSPNQLKMIEQAQSTSVSLFNIASQSQKVFNVYHEKLN